MAGGDALLGERLGHCGDELQKRQTGVDEAGVRREGEGKEGSTANS